MSNKNKVGRDEDDHSKDSDRNDDDRRKESRHKSSKHKDEKERKHKKKKKSDHKKDKKTKRSSSRDGHNKSKKHKSKKRHRRKRSDRSSSRSRRSSEDSRSQSSSDLNSSSKDSTKKRDKKNENKDKVIQITLSAANLPPVPNLSTQFGDFDSKDLKVNLKDFVSYKKKVIISNLPLNASEDEILTFLNTYISTFRALTIKEGGQGADDEERREKTKNDSNVIDNIEIRNGIYRYGVILIEDKDDIEHCVSIDGTEWKGQKIRVRRTKKFIEEYNKEIDKRLGLNAQNPMAMGIPGIPGSGEAESENKIYMGGIPTSMNSEDVRKICAAFGPLKSFNLVVDQQNKIMNRGFAFFEYSNDKDAEKAIKGLDGFEIMGKKLKIQKASLGAKPPAVQKASATVGFKNYIEPSQRVKIPLYALTPSRVVQFLNMITPEDLLDDFIKKEIFKDIVNICSLELSKDVVDIKAPSPDEKTGYCTKGVGKIFVKFNHIVAAKQARFHLSGRKYNGRTIIGCFYPEHYFDTNEFDISAD